VYKDSAVLLAKGYGYADRENFLGNEIITKFLLGSVTKEFIIAIILKKIQEHKLTLDTPITEFIPDSPKSWSLVKIKHVLAHRSGLPEYLNAPIFNSEFKPNLPTPIQIIRRLQKMRIMVRPGLVRHYSNTGYLVLGYILQAMSPDKTWPEILQEELLTPLGMHNTGIFQSQFVEKDYAVPYLSVGVRSVSTPTLDPSLLLAVGDAYSDVMDMSIFQYFLFQSQLVLDKEMKTELEGKPGDDFGLGLSSMQLAGRKVLWKTGHLAGASNIVMHIPDENLSIVVLSNVNRDAIKGVALQLATQAATETLTSLDRLAKIKN
jgi:CubicO group peptidase (beta-lactamase class C family)